MKNKSIKPLASLTATTLSLAGGALAGYQLNLVEKFPGPYLDNKNGESALLGMAIIGLPVAIATVLFICYCCGKNGMLAKLFCEAEDAEKKPMLAPTSVAPASHSSTTTTTHNNTTNNHTINNYYTVVVDPNSTAINARQRTDDSWYTPSLFSNNRPLAIADNPRQHNDQPIILGQGAWNA